MRTLLIVVVILSVCNVLGLFWLARRVPGPPREEGARPPYLRYGQRYGSRPAAPGPNERPGPKRPSDRLGMPEGEGEWFDPERMEHVREVLMKYIPELRSRLEQRTGPQQHWLRMHLMRNWHWIRELVEADREDPELAQRLAQNYRIERQLDDLADPYRRASEPQRLETEKKMRTLLEEEFEVRQWIRQRRLERLDKEIDRLRDELKQRQEKRSVLIDQALERRLKPAQRQLPEW